MHPGPQFKIKHRSGRILGPLDLERVRRLIGKAQVDGTELARRLPGGSWEDINRIPELAELLLRHAAGGTDTPTRSLRSDQSSYRPILGPAPEQFLPTVVLPGIVDPALAQAPTVVLPPTPTDPDLGPPEQTPPEAAASPPSARPPHDSSANLMAERPAAAPPARPPSETPAAAPPAAPPAEERTEFMEPLPAPPSSRRPRAVREVPAIRTEPTEFMTTPIDGPVPFGGSDPELERILAEPTVALDRPGLPPAPRARRIPRGKELARIVAIAAALGYFGYETFIQEKRDPAAQLLAKARSFRPALPRTTNAKPDPAASQKWYEEAMRYYTADHVAGYRAAAALFDRAIVADAENLKAHAMLASAYVNLIDTSTKDETFFSVVAQLIESAKAKGIDLPEIVIAESEFLVATGRPDAAVQKIVEYTKGRANFDPSLFVYVSEAFLAKGKPTEASRYLQNFPDNRAWTPRIFYLRGRISEELGDAAEAVTQYDKALKAWPTHAKSRLRRCYLAWKAGRSSESGPDLEKLLENPDLLAPRDLAQGYYLLSQYYSVKQNFPGALAAIERALKLEKGDHTYLLEYYTLLAREGGAAPGAKNEARMYFFLGEGEKLLKRGKLNDALAQFLNARNENPGSVAPLVKIGELFLQMNDLLNARANFRQAAEMAPNSIDVWSKYIAVLIQSYEWDEAQKAMDKFRKLPVGQSSIDKAAGDMYAKQGRYAEAVTYYRKAMSRESIDPDVYIAYGKILIAAKSYKDAPFFFSLARRFDPLNPEPVMLIAKAIAEVEGPEAGVQFLQDELARGSGTRAEYLAAMAELEIAKGQWDSARQYLDQARAANPEYAYPWKLQAQIYLNDENTDKKALDRALESFKSYSDRNPSDPSGYLERYRIFMKKAQFEKAAAELERIYAIYPKYPNLHLYKGVMYANMGNHKLAIEEFGSELKNNPNSASTLVSLGRSLLEVGDAKTALTHLTRAMAMAPANADAKIQAAIANHRLKNYPGAIALFAAAIQLDAGNPALYKRMGECYRDMGDAAKARGAFQKYLQMEPDAPDKAEIERSL